MWPQGETKPVFAMRKAFSAAVSDLAWSPITNALFAASMDGTIMTVLFGDAELGPVMDRAKVRLITFFRTSP